ncbi:MULTISPECIES: TRAP transporter substrate-binding protein [unclassified Aminobacter]|jgi:tripartite ATP-independent transporter DctP family solute receptor|uniref:TRAP transporter substrate-binding protein n=1 Tax=unclassified Aminobacter TaxID=2644704 RepID=UPI000465A82F|nr:MULTISPECIES: TRAP transporter substrate-binding protein [unclassified Aminobacter]TWH23990.1 tripartite ATP-independent transporter DctP family solute receptor [Aminobacter sp. J15]
MKKLITAAVLGMLMAGTAHADISFRIGGAGSESSPDTKAMEVFTEKLKERLGDGVEVELYPNSHLGTVDEMVEQVKGGVLECMYESVGVLGSFHPAANIEGVAYVYHDVDHFFRIWRGPVGQEILDSIANEAGFRVVGPAFHGFRQMLTNKPIEKAEDLDGMKIRAPGIPAYIESIRAMGASPTTVAFEEVYAALQSHVVDGVEQPLTAIKDKRFHEVVEHLALTNHMAETMGFMCNAEWYAGLDDAIRAAIEAAAVDSADWYRAYTEESQAKLLADLEAEGAKVTRPDTKAFIERVSAANYDPALQPIIEKVRAVE